MILPSVKDLKVAGKKVLLRTNYDVFLKEEERDGIGDDSRIVESLPTINYLLQQKAKIIIISHLGRPQGKRIPGLSLAPVARYLTKILSRPVPLAEKGDSYGAEIVLWENLRFHPGEEANDKKFAQNLANQADFYINDAFACSHRKHASIVSLPQFFPASRRAVGFDFLEETKGLLDLYQKPKRPLVLIVGGGKKDKIEMAKKLLSWVDYLLIGGNLVAFKEVDDLLKNNKVIGSLVKEGEDISRETEAKFKKVIGQAKTVVWVGPLGFFEKEEYVRGTREVAKAIVESGAFLAIGGGDTEAAFTKFGLVDEINFVSSGGGAMLTFLGQGTLPGIEAIKKKND